MVDMTQYEEKISQGQFTDFYESRASDSLFPLNEIDKVWARKVLFLHDYVKRNIDYSSESGQYVQKPRETLEKGEGDCEDQTVLLSNLYLDAGKHVKIFVGGKMNESVNHVFPFVYVGLTGSLSADELRAGFEVMWGDYPSEMSWLTIDDYPYFVADPIYSDYVGDRGRLTGEYIKESGDSWEIYDEKGSLQLETEQKNTVTVRV